jgi:uncharacterized protein
VNAGQLEKLESVVRKIYSDNAHKVPYHGWHHIDFVVKRVEEFIEELGAERFITLAAALVHDFNYLVAMNSPESIGRPLREDVLTGAGFSPGEISRIEKIISEARTSARHAEISAEAKALSDADTAYKALPIIPLMSIDYLIENGVTLRDLARKIVSEQKPLEDQGFYFYSSKARETYGEWGILNLQAWTRVLKSLEDPEVERIAIRATIASKVEE